MNLRGEKLELNLKMKFLINLKINKNTNKNLIKIL